MSSLHQSNKNPIIIQCCNYQCGQHNKIVVERAEQGHAYKVQRSTYYISEVLLEYKVHYLHVQKILYVVLIISRK
jgi:hypothetical protein